MGVYFGEFSFPSVPARFGCLPAAGSCTVVCYSQHWKMSPFEGDFIGDLPV